MEKILKSHLLGKVFISILFFSIHLSFIISLLNPQLPIRTDTSLFLFFSIFLFSFITFGMVLLWLFWKFSKYSNLILIIFCFLVIMIYFVEKNLHPLFFHPSLYKLINKGLWASSITFLGILFLKNHKRILLIIIIISAIFLYQRRDGIKFRSPAPYPLELELKDKPLFYFYVLETGRSKNFLEELKEKEDFKGFYKIMESGSRGVFKLPGYLKGEILKTTIFTGTYPYIHRNFGEKTNSFLPLYNIDLFPFFFPKILKKESYTEIPFLWDILKNFKIPLKVSGFEEKYSYENDRPLFYIYHKVGKDNEEEILKKDIEELLLKIKEEDYFCVLLPQKGFFFIRGKHIKKDFVITSMKLVDPLPTILFLYNIPLGNYFSGRILVECIEDDYLKENPINIIGKY